MTNEELESIVTVIGRVARAIENREIMDVDVGAHLGDSEEYLKNIRDIFNSFAIMFEDLCPHIEKIAEHFETISECIDRSDSTLLNIESHLEKINDALESKNS